MVPGMDTRSYLLIATFFLAGPACGDSRSTTKPDGAPDAPGPDDRADVNPDRMESATDGADGSVDGPTDGLADQADATTNDSVDSGDAGAGCPACASDEICVVLFDGICHQLAPRCAKKTARCQTPVCNDDCNAAFCGVPDGGPIMSTCMARDCPTSGQFPNAIRCYGP
jgi:hypothetical protein